ncbi:phosphopantetheine-binding protein [Cytobacillus pseudoceanisediminis]|uniref:phosphopantetheine-binding protein n=1 Tax=Cytobacillus pseudoceanisediminis TaxID=3051614 RepID=UPI003C30AA86
MELKEILYQLIQESSDGLISKSDLEQAGDDLKSLGLNSLAKITFIVFIEEEFNIAIDSNIMASGVLDSLSKLISYIETKTSV